MDDGGGTGDSHPDGSALPGGADAPGYGDLPPGVAVAGYGDVAPDAAVRAARGWWDGDADAYQDEHGAFLGGDSGGAEFVWCPEGLQEADARLLGDVRGRVVVEVGCGAAQCGRWLTAQGARVVAVDLSAGMLRHARALSRRTGVDVPLVQADARRLPLPDGAADLACSAFGAVPFVVDSAAVMAEVARVLRPGGRWVFSVTHPLRWVFPDDPGPGGLTVTRSYFDRTPYVEAAEDGTPRYVEQHRTVGDRVREVVGAGLELVDLLEPEWPPGHERPWGQWSPLRGRLMPGTSIWVCRRPG